jgi:hypothetical protein
MGGRTWLCTTKKGMTGKRRARIKTCCSITVCTGARRQQKKSAMTQEVCGLSRFGSQDPRETPGQPSKHAANHPGHRQKVVPRFPGWSMSAGRCNPRNNQPDTSSLAAEKPAILSSLGQHRSPYTPVPLRCNSRPSLTLSPSPGWGP